MAAGQAGFREQEALNGQRNASGTTPEVAVLVQVGRWGAPDPVREGGPCAGNTEHEPSTV